MAYTHLFFGGIGTLVETSAQQLAAFNQAFANLGIDFVWSEKAYADSLTEAGGQHRLRKLELDDGHRLSEDQIQQVHAEKTRLFNDTIVSDGLELRAGVAELIKAAHSSDIKLGWVTTTSQDNLDAICRAAGDALSRDLFVFIGDAAQADASKPAPDIYRVALEQLAVEPSAALAIEDSPTGVSAAKSAGIAVAAFPGKMHAGHDFSAADHVVDSLSELVPKLEG